MSVTGTDIGHAPADPAARKVFVSYRRSDSPSAARQVADALRAHFGHVFFDTKDLQPGTSWYDDIRRAVADADLVVAVIGPRWVTIADDRGRRHVLHPEEEDVLRTEIEAALRGPGRLVPVLVDDAVMPTADALPRPFKPLARLQAVNLRHASWEQDLAGLIEWVDLPPAEPAATDAGPAVAPPPPSASDWEPVPGGPKVKHYRNVAGYLTDGSLVPVLGSAVHETDDRKPWSAACGRLPSARELALALGEHFGLEARSIDLAEVAQQIVAVEGAKPLDLALRQLLKDDCDPSPVHRLLARVPATLRDRGTEGYQLLVTTTYDTALERAFDEVHEPFDLVVFMATGEHAGRFLHIPWWDAEGAEATPILVPNEYVQLPIDEDEVLSRTVILKIHGGAVHDGPSTLRLQENFVITEDDYIGFLSESPVESLVPVQLLNKLRDSHFLFLGYGVRDWNLRVFLRRVWVGGEPGARSWAVAPHSDDVDEEFWRALDVERFDVALVDYLAGVQHHLRV